jgi:hypothetical protein
LAAKSRKRRENKKRRGAQPLVEPLSFLVVFVPFRGYLSSLVGFLHPLEIFGPTAGAERAEATEDDAKEQESPGHGKFRWSKRLVGGAGRLSD